MTTDVLPRRSAGSLVLAAGGRPAAGQGDDVYPVTLTRLGVARTWPVARSTSTPTSPDVVNLVEFEDLHDVVLVGHGYAGLVVTAVADRIPERISVLAYLRQLLDSPPQREEIRAGLWRFYTACATADMPETTRLATTIETWWPATLVALTTRTTNARTEGSNRIIKQVKRAAADSATSTTTSGSSRPTSQSPDRASRRHERGRPAQPRRAPFVSTSPWRTR